VTIWTALWIAWGLAFAAIEGVALTRDRREGATLSQHLRRWFRTDTHTGRTVWLVACGVFGAWFLIHIATPAGWL
jgi:hypothetical protein